MTAGCNWVVATDDAGQLCRSCQLTRARPPDGDDEAHQRFVEAESAKRRLVAQLIDLRLPITSFHEHPEGLAFDLLSSRFDEVMIGHEDGVITLDLAEADGAYRERVRTELGEAYRTVLGHLRHEVGHYYWMVLVRDAGRVDEFRSGSATSEPATGALAAHYGGPGPTGWDAEHVSAYATMHPWEDWAETFAHYLHLRDTLQTAAQSGVRVTDPSGAGEVPRSDGEDGAFEAVAADWIALAAALNALSRSMGAADLYPFVLAPAVIDKLAYVDSLVRATATA
ncbi:MAG: putative zinc-binding metallopeptidase [Acidimicrobiales bacterium]